MKAVKIHDHGDSAVLKIEDVAMPVVKSGEVLIRVYSVALNHLDLWVRKGIPGIQLPLIPGSDGAGTISEFGPELSELNDFKLGDSVIILPFNTCKQCKYCLNGAEELCPDYRIRGEHFDGTMAEFSTVPISHIRKKPTNTDMNNAAAYPLSFMTAYHMLKRKVTIRPDDWILIWGASSGVGHAAIQIAKYLGAKVISTAGDKKKMDFAYQMGSDYVINYKNSIIPEQIKTITNGKGVDIVFEHVGQQSWQDSLKALARNGKIITCGATTGPLVRINLNHLFIKHQQIIGSTMGNMKDMDEVSGLIEKGMLTPHVDKIFKMENLVDAHNYLESGKQMGKVVVTMLDA